MPQNAASYYLSEQLVEHLFGSTPYVRPLQYFLGLWIGDPGRDGLAGGAEVSASDYERLPVTMNRLAGQQKARNANNLIWATPTENWSEVTHWALYDNLTDANILFSGEWDTPVNVLDGGDPFEVPIGGLEINLASPA